MKLLQCDRTLGIIMWWFTCALVLYGVMGVNNVSGTDNVCSLRQFQCANGRCIPHTWMCEGEDDCGDNSDETAKECHEPSGPRATPQPDKLSSSSSVAPPVITWTLQASPFTLVWNLISQNKTAIEMTNNKTTTVVPSLLTFYHVPVSAKEETSAMPLYPSHTLRPTTVEATESVQLVTESYSKIPSRISVTPPSLVVTKQSSEEDKNEITEDELDDDDKDISDEYIDDVKMDVLALVDLVKGRLMSQRTRPSSVRRPSSNSTVKSNSTRIKTTAAPVKQVDTGDLTIQELSELTENALRLRAARLNVDVLRRQSQMLREERRKLSAEREMLGASRDMFQAEMRRSQAERDRIMSEHQKLELERDMLQSQMLGRGFPVRSFNKA